MEEITDRYDEGYNEGFDDCQKDLQDALDNLRLRIHDLERAIANALQDLSVL